MVEHSLRLVMRGRHRERLHEAEAGNIQDWVQADKCSVCMVTGQAEGMDALENYMNVSRNSM